MRRNIKLQYIVEGNQEYFRIIDNDKITYHCNNTFLNSFINLVSTEDNEIDEMLYTNEIFKHLVENKRRPYVRDHHMIKKVKCYIDKCIDNSFYSSYEVFHTACELGTFSLTPHTNYEFPDSVTEKLNDEKRNWKNMFDKIDFIYSVHEKGNNIKIIYELNSLGDFISACLLETFRRKVKLKKCENCNKYSIIKRKDARYCNNPSPQNPNKTCSQYKKEENYKEKLKNDEELALFKKMINTLNKNYHRTKDDYYKKKISNLTSFYENKKLQKEKGEITKEEFHNDLLKFNKF